MTSFPPELWSIDAQTATRMWTGAATQVFENTGPKGKLLPVLSDQHCNFQTTKVLLNIQHNPKTNICQPVLEKAFPNIKCKVGSVIEDDLKRTKSDVRLHKGK